MRKTLLVDADYECYPLWIRDEEGLRNVHPNEVKLSADLVERLLSWAGEYDAILKWDNPASSDFPTRSAYESFVRRGKLLSEEVDKQLDGEWRVIYLDSIAGKEIEITPVVD